jgi:predicted metal-dependent hydrolase
MKRRRHRRSRKSQRLLGEVESWAAKIGVAPRIVYVQPMKKKWASCSVAGSIYLSGDLISEPPGFRDAVIVHELLHLRVANHGKLFRSLMSAFLPGWQAAAEGKIRGRCALR